MSKFYAVNFYENGKLIHNVIATPEEVFSLLEKWGIARLEIEWAPMLSGDVADMTLLDRGLPDPSEE